MDTVNQAANTPTAGEQPTGRTFTQDEVNTIIADRLNRERAKYADYEDLKVKASQYDAAQQQLDQLTHANTLRDLRAKVSAETGVPADLLTGETIEDCTAQANKIKAFAAPAGYPSVYDGGELDERKARGSDRIASAFRSDLKHKPKEFNPFW